MNYMEDILNQIKARPGMYLGDRKLTNLHAFMNGYMYRMFQEDDIIPEFCLGFQEYITEIYDIKTGQHWEKILDFYSESEEEELQKFFYHLENYIETDGRDLDFNY